MSLGANFSFRSRLWPNRMEEKPIGNNVDITAGTGQKTVTRPQPRMDLPRKALCTRWILLVVLAIVPSFHGLAQQPTTFKRGLRPANDERPFAIPDSPFGLTTRDSIRMELAFKIVGDQIEAKHAREIRASALDGFWHASFWRFIPFVPGGPSKLAEDPFVTPNYLLLSYRQSELELAISERPSLWEIVSGHRERKR